MFLHRTVLFCFVLFIFFSSILFMFVALTNDGRLCFVYSFNSFLLQFHVQELWSQRVFEEFLFVFRSHFDWNELIIFVCLCIRMKCIFGAREKTNVLDLKSYIWNITLSQRTHSIVDHKLNSITSSSKLFRFIFVWAYEYTRRTANRQLN